MSNGLLKQIYDRMNLKETEELLEIWQSNDRFEWSDEAFDAINEVLIERGVKIPEQGEPVYEHIEEDTDDKDYKFSKEELKIIDDENPPTFYDPYEVLLLTKRLDWMVKAMIVFAAVYNILNFPTSKGVAQGFLIRDPNSIFVYVIATLITILNIGISIIVVYVPLKALSRILRILMEMEFRSRKEIKSNPVVE